VVEPDFILSGSETFFNRPPRSGHVNEFPESRVVWIIAVVEASSPLSIDRRIIYL